ncbi:MAG TPA: PilZ domain-containing protein [Planctomycetota bacterium]|nr:PilZ domain-containing protein [Planctomycetota bacterium]
MAHEERRGRPRFKLSWPIWLLRNDQELAHGRTDNISRSGAYFLSAVPGAVEPGMTVSVRIGVSGETGADAPEQTITGDAHVVRLEEEEGGRGIALHFSQELAPFTEAEPRS